MNPYKVLRQSLALTQVKLAQLAGLTRQVVQKTESYLYAMPPPALTYALVRLCRGSQMACTSTALEEGYLVGAQRQRKANSSYFKLYPNQPPPLTWLAYRNQISASQYGFALLLVFDLGLLQAFEKDYHTGRKQLLSALSDIIPASEELWKILEDLINR